MLKEQLTRTDSPLLCTPIVGTTKEEIMEEVRSVKGKKPDMIEWRVDYFEDISDFQKVMLIADTIKQSTDNIPLLFTIRSVAEGGNPTDLTTSEIVELLSIVCKSSNSIDIIDYEIANPEEYTRHLRSVSQENDKLLLLSFHNYTETPSNDELHKVLEKAKSLGADIAKIAVMPNNRADVLRLLTVTNKANEELKIPIATMSLGSLGSLTRMAGWIFGSVIVFTVGAKSSAPGQIPIEEMRKLIHAISEYQD
jgi:3-dehydroquinate dehydratase I